MNALFFISNADLQAPTSILSAAPPFLSIYANPISMETHFIQIEACSIQVEMDQRRAESPSRPIIQSLCMRGRISLEITHFLFESF